MKTYHRLLLASTVSLAIFSMIVSCNPSAPASVDPGCCHEEPSPTEFVEKKIMLIDTQAVRWTTAEYCPCDSTLIQLDSEKWGPEEQTAAAHSTTKSEHFPKLNLTDNPVIGTEYHEQGRTNSDLDITLPPPSRPIKVAILDSGLSPELLAAHAHEIAEFRNTYDLSEDVMDSLGHGSAVFAVIDGHAQNKARYYIYKCIGDDGYATAFSIACALKCAQKNGVDVINMSFGSYADDTIIHDIIENQLRHPAMISSRGNDCRTDEDFAHYPSRYTRVWGILGLNAHWKEQAFGKATLWECCNGAKQGTNFAAPSIITSMDDTAESSGTSFAAAFVTGRFINYLSRPEYRDMNPHEVFRDTFLKDKSKTRQTTKYLHAAHDSVNVTIITDRDKIERR